MGRQSSAHLYERRHRRSVVLSRAIESIFCRIFLGTSKAVGAVVSRFESAFLSGSLWCLALVLDYFGFLWSEPVSLLS
ncbi:hypothetical protein IGI04_019735 [Brassica rapa subsp. trilocularis]|uniref:Uncharacterized protein n=1 Tax=Brassica rapa subsp. trilocularis TaxID=1813537 RepID=A0ABQ7MGP5_BRACM|nr:hypothetical protein IGI04_019735 [Brassica rapa subsp. trilocularis]